MDIENIKKQFPQFTNNSNLVYLDSAATSLTPEPVLEAIDAYYRGYRSNAHRGLYREAQKATEMFEQARAHVASFIGADDDEIVFTGGATLSANMVVRSLEESDVLKGDTVVVTQMEHHAVLLPIQGLVRRQEMTLRYITLDGVRLDTSAIASCITKETALVVVTLASNVTGCINEIGAIVERAHACDALVVVDGTAGVGHMPVNVKALGADFLFFSGHKMCGPTGIGVLYGKKELLTILSPSIVGGGIVDTVNLSSATYISSPQKFEAGTQHVAGVIGLGRAVHYLASIGMDVVRSHARHLVTYAYERLSHEQGVRLYAAPPEENIGIISFTVEGIHPHDVADVAGRKHVALRAGHHCALPLHDALGVPATVRASMYLYNDTDDVDVLIERIREVKKLFS